MTTAQNHFDELADTTAQTARDAANTARRSSSKALDKVIATANEWRDEAAPMVNRVRNKVAQASDRTVGYVREEPVRTVLMAAAAGVLVYAAVRLLNGRRDR